MEQTLSLLKVALNVFLGGCGAMLSRFYILRNQSQDLRPRYGGVIKTTNVDIGGHSL
jgi:hypothetical protein